MQAEPAAREERAARARVLELAYARTGVAGMSSLVLDMCPPLARGLELARRPDHVPAPQDRALPAIVVSGRADLHLAPAQSRVNS